MRVALDESKCSAHGVCAALAPGIFRVADDGTLQILVDVLDESHLPLVEEAIEACPTAALRLVPSERCRTA